jgi:DNA-binding transcriptional LysR family regulator
MKLHSMDLNLLLAFDALAEEQSVTRAAARLGMSQPAMSGALARLRLLLGDPLFVRSRGRMRPTPRARQLAAPIGAAIARLRDAIEPGPKFRAETARTEFRIAASDYVEVLVMAPLVTALAREAPGVSVRSVRPTRVFMPPEEALRAGDVDLALGLFGSPPSPMPDLLSTPLFRDRMVGVVRARHPGVGARLTLKRFIAIPQIRILYLGDVHSGLVDSVLASRGLERRVALTVSNLVSVPAVVARSDLLGVAPERLAREWGRARPLKILDLPIPLPAMELAMVWDERRGSHAAHEWLRGAIERAIAEQR